MAKYDYRIEYYPETVNIQTDIFSRKSDYTVEIKKTVPAIFKKNKIGNLVYNYQILVATSEIQNNNWIGRLKKNLVNNLLTTKKINRDYLKKENGLIYIHRLIYIPQKLQNKTIRQYYDNFVYSYIETEKTVEQFSKNYYIPNIYKKIAKYIKKYDIYQKNKSVKYKLYSKIQISEIPIRL